MVNGVPIKKITEKELSEIIEEYNLNKKDYQKEITKNDDNTYLLPMNYPLGIADIEHYIDLSKYDGGKKEYTKALSNISRIIFVGENEEAVTGHFSYIDGRDIDGSKQYEEERASMHNRVLRYISATRALFGKSANDRLKNFMQLTKELGITVQNKIYEDVGHEDIYNSKYLLEDCSSYYDGITKGENRTLSNKGGKDSITPVHQLVRRYIVSENQEEYNDKVEILEQIGIKIDDRGKIHGQGIRNLLKHVNEYVDSKNNENITYDNLTTEEICEIVENRRLEVENNNEIAIKISEGIAKAFAKELEIRLAKERAQKEISSIGKIIDKDENLLENQK